MAKDTVAQRQALITFPTDEARSAFVDSWDKASSAAHKLEALLSLTVGTGAESFGEMATQIRENYMWACGDLAHEVVDALHELDRLRVGREVQGGAQ